MYLYYVISYMFTVIVIVIFLYALYNIPPGGMIKNTMLIASG